MDGNRLIGKVNPRHRVCYLPHNGLEVIVADHVAKNHDIILVILMQPFSKIFCSGSSLLILSAHPSTVKTTNNALTGK